MSQRVPVLLDTDIGSNVDDAIALAYLLREPRCELLGITTVTGDVATRAACAEVICRAAGREEVPIYCGVPGPLLWGPGQPGVPQYDAIHHRPHSLNGPTGTAIEFLRRAIRSRPHEVTLLSIGPFTNVALLFALDPQIPSLLKQLVSMAGVFFPHERVNETNCRTDPIATAMVYAARPPRHVSIGLDVTTRCRMSEQEVRSRFVRPPLDVVREIAEVWFARHDKVIFHDPLAAATIFEPKLCDYQEGIVNIDVSPDPSRGVKPTFTQVAGGPHRVATTVDVGAFFAHLFSTLE